MIDIKDMNHKPNIEEMDVYINNTLFAELFRNLEKEYNTKIHFIYYTIFE